MMRKSSLAALTCTLLICDAAARSEWLYVGRYAGNDEKLVIDSGTYDGASVGIAGNGTLINDGAVLHRLALGTASNGVGTYIQNGSSAAVIVPGGWLEIGAFYGTGHVIQNAGTIDYSGGLVLLSFHNFDNNVTYTLNGGTLIADTTAVGSYSGATFIQTGGLHRAHYLDVAGLSGVGTYLLSGGTLQVTGGEGVGRSSLFAQTGGLNITPALGIGSEGMDVPGTYALSGGTLVTGRLGVSRVQSFIQTGGFLSVSKGFFSGGGDATFGNATWAGGATFETHGGAQTLTVDSGSAASHNLSMTLFAFPGYPPGRGDPRVTFESSQHLASLTINAGSVALTPGGNKVLETDSLTVGGKVDLNDNDLLWDFDYNGPSPIGIVRNLIASARYAGGGVWKGGGITSSMADANTFGLGYWNKFDYVDVKRTLYGDANGDGVVDMTDLGTLASHWQTSNDFWADGDFSYDGVVDVSDLGLLARNWQAGADSLDAALATLGLPATSIPEPLALPAAVGAAMLAWLMRRRRTWRLAVVAFFAWASTSLAPFAEAAPSLSVGNDPGSDETVIVNSGTYDSATIGYYGSGTLINNGAVIGDLNMAYDGNAMYIQNGNSASVMSLDPYMVLSFFGSSAVVQNGGTFSDSGTMTLSFHGGNAHASYTLNAGTLITGQTTVAAYGYGTFVQTGGLHQTGVLEFGHPGYGAGTYLLSGGSLQVSTDESLTDAHFIQSGGSNSAPALYMGGYGLIPASSYQLSGGTLELGTLYLAQTDAFWQSGGVLVINGFHNDESDARFGNTIWSPGSTFQTSGGVQTLTVDSGGPVARNLSMTVQQYQYPGASTKIVLESSQHLASLNIQAGSVTLTPGADKVLDTPELQIDGIIDLNDNQLIWRYSGPSPIQTVRDSIESARNSAAGAWKGNGITSSMADTRAWGLGYWDQGFIDVRRTFYGDANGDGALDVTDLGALASHWQTSNNFWADGDFTYDGVVDVTDLALLAGNWTSASSLEPQAGNALSIDQALAAVGLGDVSLPEPMSAGIAVLGLCLRRHRRIIARSCRDGAAHLPLPTRRAWFIRCAPWASATCRRRSTSPM